MPAVFGFWTQGPGPHGKEFPAACRDAWRAFDPDFTIFGDEAVVGALSRWSKQVQDLFLDIRIPACRSDIARLALLSEFGGTYVDGHTAPGDPDLLRDYLKLTERYDLTVPQFDPHESPIPYNRLFNSPLSARAGVAVVTALLRRALANLSHQRDAERARGVIDLDYSIFDLTGPNMIRDKIVDFSRHPFELHAALTKVVHVIDLGPGPFQLYRHSDYRKGREHWTRREKAEPLFYSSEQV